MTRKAFKFALAAMTLGLASVAHAQENVGADSMPRIVLVHGAFVDGSGWRGVYEELTKRGYKVAIVQNPLTSLQDDVAATRRVIERQPGSVILVGHSWGGSVITEAGVHPQVVGLVYVSALVPDAGETTAQQYDGFPPASDFVIDTHAGYGIINLDRFREAFAADTRESDSTFMRDSQVPINMAVFATRLTQAAWRTKPSWAVIAKEDKAFGEGMLVHMATRINAQITEVPGSHAVFMTQPKAVADVIERAARTVSSNR